jgi:signal transduction histidine kinase
MVVSRFRRRVLVAITLGVALPAAVLTSLGIYLTLRIARAIDFDTVRYNTYMGQQVAQAFEQELMAHLRRGVGPAENAAREGRSVADIRAALAAGTDEFSGANFVPLESLNNVSLLIVESQPLIFAPGENRRQGLYFAGVLLHGPDGQVIGAGGWWIDPLEFLRRQVDAVFHERMPANPRLYGGIENTRKLSIELFDSANHRIGHVREPGNLGTARTEPLQGPFDGFTVRIAATANAPASWTGRFLALELAFIALMGLAILAAAMFGYRYTVRHLELALLKSGFVSNVTHELKTPIALIRLAVETLEMRRVASPEETDRFLQTIGRETQRLSQLVDNILDFARLEAGQGVFRFAPVDVAGLVHEAVESLGPRFEHLGFKVEVNVPEGTPPALGDPLALTHCLLNLLDNAIKYSRARREITVAAGARDGHVTISVTDRGIGIAPGDRKRIFEKFVRLENGLIHDVRGAGLGLSLVDQIMRAHHGRIEVGGSLNEGSTFTLVLPMAAGAESDRAEPQRKTAS